MMQGELAGYPVRIVSRQVARQRLRRFSLAALTAAGFAAIAAYPPFSINTSPDIRPIAPITVSQLKVAASLRPATYPLALTLKAESGDTLMNLLTDAGASPADARQAVAAVKKIYDPRKLTAGQNISLKLDKGEAPGAPPVLEHVRLPASPVMDIELARQADGSGFTAKKQEVPTEWHDVHVSGRINSSLYVTAEKAGLPPSLIDEIINAYSYDVDFQRDIQPGDRIDVLFNRLETGAGRHVGQGHVMYADLTIGNRHLRIYRYTDRQGNTGYYDAKGESVRKALLRTPIPGARITSSFGMRFHPILGYSRMHRGEDFGAPVGTPIFAAGDGVVKVERLEHGYGNFMVLQHNRIYSTAYAHISHFARGIHVGSRVKQGQVIAYVGMTGLATGPHLHFEVRVNGSQVNPAKVKFKTGAILAGRDLKEFRHTVAHIRNELADIPENGGEKLAMN